MATFKKGQSGNPGGRPKALRGMRAELEARYGDGGKALLDQLDKLRRSKNERVAFDALKLALAYHVGQPTQRHEIDEAPKVPQVFTFNIVQAPDSDNRT